MVPETPDFQAYCGSEPPRFANPAELEYAKILDWYGIPWLYEPTTFVLERDDEGRVTEAFTPDFYLPDQDLYLEVTVMKQSLVTRKNRKLRKLRAALSRGARQTVLRARLRAARSPVRAREGVLTAAATHDDRIGEVFLDAAEIARARARDRRGDRTRLRRPRAVARRLSEGVHPVHLRPLARDPIHARARLRRARRLRHGETTRIRFLKDLDREIAGRDVLLVDAVIDTG